MNYFVTGIGTEVGKTVASAILVQAFQLDYWKPVQCGDLDYSDSMKIKQWVQKEIQIHPEAYRLDLPMSPHAAADAESVEIKLDQFQLPNSQNGMIVEGAGGLMVPLNGKDLMIDLIGHLQIPAILVSRHYLGSINHTLLSVEMLKQANIPLHGLIFMGDEHPTTEAIITKHVGADKIMGRIDELEAIDSENIKKAAEKLEQSWPSLQPNSIKI